MPRVVCRYIDCIYLENSVCSADSVIIDPDEGCLTYAGVNDLEVENEWDDNLDEYDDDELLYEDEDDEEEDWLD